MATTEIINFTKENVANLPLVDKGRKLYRDIREKYLFLFVTSKNKTFYFYKKYDGKPIQIKIRTELIRLARDKVAEYNAMIAKGIDPVEEKKRVKAELMDEVTLDELFKLYVSDKRDEKKTIKNDISNFKVHLKCFENMNIKSIKYENIYRLHKKMINKPYAANRVLSLLSAIYNYGKSTLKIDITNPCKGIKKHKEYSKQRILSKSELKRYLKVCDKWKEFSDKILYSDILKVLLYTGQRRGNVLNMKFSSIDLEERKWLLIPEETKNSEYNIIPLVDEVYEILQRRYDEVGKDSIYVFPSPQNYSKPMYDIKRQWRNFLEEAKISSFTIHDVRRTAGSILLMNTGNLKLVQKFLGHKDITTTARVYAHIWESKMSDAVNNAFKRI